MAARKRKRAEPAPGWAWMLFGLSIGLAVALIVYLKTGKPGDPPVYPETVTQNLTPDEADNRVPEPSSDPIADERASDDGTEDTDFSFFEDLREFEVTVQQGELEFRAGDQTPRETIIQAGAFRDLVDADERQANLALFGIESRIVSAIVEDDLWFRVVIGPLTERGRINNVVDRLRKERIDFFFLQKLSN